MGNIGGKNSGWRGWVFYLDSLRKPTVKIVHSLSHNYLHVSLDQSVEVDEWTHLFFTYDGSAKANGLKIYLNGQLLEQVIHFDNLYKSIQPMKGRGYTPDPKRSIKMGRGNIYLYSDTDDGVLKGSLDQLRIYQRYLTAIEVAAIYRQEMKAGESDPELSKEAYLEHYLYRNDAHFQKLTEELRELRNQKFNLLDSIEEVMVLEEMSVSRKTYLLKRGQYDSPGQEVQPATPSALLPFPEHLPKKPPWPGALVI